MPKLPRLFQKLLYIFSSFCQHARINYTGDIRYITSYAAIAAYGIELLSQASGVDLYEVLKKARQSETEVSAKREFVQILNSIRPGLYKDLRDLQYDQKTGDFEKGLEIIKDAIGEKQKKINHGQAFGHVLDLDFGYLPK